MKKRILAILLVVSMLFSLPGAAFAQSGHTEGESPYKDVSTTAWYYDEVLWAYEEGLMIGVGNQKFDPDGATTRAMLVLMLYRLEGQPEVENTAAFSDVAADGWYADAINWAHSEGIVLGYGETFGPDDPLTREQMVTILYRYAEYKGHDVTAANSLLSFVDEGTISDYARKAFSWANSIGLIKGVSDTQIQPKGTAIRAQIAVAFYRFFNILEQEIDVTNKFDLSAEKFWGTSGGWMVNDNGSYVWAGENNNAERNHVSEQDGVVSITAQGTKDVNLMYMLYNPEDIKASMETGRLSLSIYVSDAAWLKDTWSVFELTSGKDSWIGESSLRWQVNRNVITQEGWNDIALYFSDAEVVGEDFDPTQLQFFWFAATNVGEGVEIKLKDVRLEAVSVKDNSQGDDDQGTDDPQDPSGGNEDPEPSTPPYTPPYIPPYTPPASCTHDKCEECGGCTVEGCTHGSCCDPCTCPPPCEHEKCAECEGCIEENCQCTEECCTKKCECEDEPVIPDPVGTATYVITADGHYGTDGAWKVWTGSDYVVLADKGNDVTYKVTVDTGDKKEGEGAIQIIASSERDTNLMYHLYEKGDMGLTKENGKLTFWLYVEDPSVLQNWNAVQIASGWINENCLSWGLTPEMVQQGWNEITLNFADATETGTFDPSALNLFWFCVTNTEDGDTFKLDNIRISGDADTSCKHEICETCGGCTVADCECAEECCAEKCECEPLPECEHETCRICGGCKEAECACTDECCAIECPGEGNHPRDAAFTPATIWTYWTTEGKNHLENDVDQSEEGLGYMDGERKYLCSGGLTKVGDRLWSSFVSGDTNEREGNYLVLVTSGDNGDTWTEVSVVVEHMHENVCVADSTLWTDPEGRLWVFWTQDYLEVPWRNYDYDVNNHHYTGIETFHSDELRGVWCMYAEDGDTATPTFSDPVRLCDGMIMNKPVVATINGQETWLITPYMSSWLGLDDPATSETMGPTIYTFSLDEDGVPYAEFYSRIMEDPYAQISTFRNYCEPMTVQLDDGRLMMIVRTDKGIEVVYTTDELTAAPYTGGWTELDYLRDNGAIVTRTAARTHLTKLADGTLLLIYHDTDNASRYNMTAALSYDNGQTWPDQLLLDARAVSYVDAVVAEDGYIYVQYDNERYGLMELLVSRITVDDIKNGTFGEGSFSNKIINDNDYNKPFTYYVDGGNLLDTAGNWFGTNATSDGYKKYGTEAANSFTSYEDGVFTVTSSGTENPTGLVYLTTDPDFIDTGMTIEGGAVVFDIWVDDYTSFVNKWGVVYIGDNNDWVGASMGKQLSWNMRNVIYKNGWNTVWLNLKDATGDKTIDLSHIGGFWLYSNQVPDGGTIKVRNVRFVEYSATPVCDHEKCEDCTGCTVENCDHSADCCTPCDCCKHLKCNSCGGCLDANCGCTIEDCCTPCDCCKHEDKCDICGGCIEANCECTDLNCCSPCGGKLDAVFSAPKVYTYWTEEGKAYIDNATDSAGYGYNDGERLWQGCPGIGMAGDRLWVVAMTGGVTEDHHNYITVFTSGDGGETWTDSYIVIDHENQYVRCWDPYIFNANDGAIWIVWTQEYTEGKGWTGVVEDVDDCDGRMGVWAMKMTNASSATPTLSDPIRLSDGTANNGIGYVTIEGREVMMLCTYNMPLKVEKSGQKTDVVGPCLYICDPDTGEWRLWSQIDQNAETDMFCEHDVAQLPDGSLIVMIRTSSGIQYHKTEGALTLDKYTGTWTAKTPVMNGENQLTTTVSRIALDNIPANDGSGEEWMLLIYHNSATGARANLTAAISKDGGATWVGNLLIYAGDEANFTAGKGVSYPETAITEDGTIYIAYDWNRYSDSQFLLAKITVEDVLAGELVTDGSYLSKLINNNSYNKPADVYSDGVQLTEENTSVKIKTGSDIDYVLPSEENYDADGALTFTSTEGTIGIMYSKIGENYLNSNVTVTNGQLVIDLYVSDKDALQENWGTIQINDSYWTDFGDGLNWHLRNAVYQDGWNRLYLNLSDAVSYSNSTNHGDGTLDLDHIGMLWITCIDVPAGVTIKIGDVQFLEKNDDYTVTATVQASDIKVHTPSSYLTAGTDALGRTSYTVNTAGWANVRKEFNGINTGVTMSNGYLLLDFYVSDASEMKNVILQINDSWWDNFGDYINFSLDTTKLHDGWNYLKLKLSDGTAGSRTGQSSGNGDGTLNLSGVKYLFANLEAKTTGVVLKMENVRFAIGPETPPVPTCEHERCAECGGCLVENCTCTEECCTKKCTCDLICEHTKCLVCGGCLDQNWQCEINDCCTKACSCTVDGYEQTKTIPVPSTMTGNQWVSSGQWLAATNKSSTWNPFHTYADTNGNKFCYAENATLFITAGQDPASGGGTVTGFFMMATGGEKVFDTSVTVAKGRLCFDFFVSNAADVNTKSVTIEIADMNGNGNWVNQGNRLRWNLDDVTLVKGWNRIELELADATVIPTGTEGKSTTFDPSNLGYFWIYVKNMTDGDKIGIRNIGFETLPVCEHEKCETCSGCLAEDCNHEDCCTSCTCPVVSWDTTYTFSVPEASAANTWISGGRWCAGTNGSGYWWPTASDLVNGGSEKLVAYNGTEIKVTAGQTSGTGSSPTGLMFIAADSNVINSGVTAANGRLILDIYVSDASEANANGLVVEMGDINYKTNRWHSDGNRLKWTLSGTAFVDGWNTIALELADATFTASGADGKPQTFDPTQMLYFRIYENNMAHGNQLGIRNVKFQEKIPANQ